jgi:hypothetical protein
MLMALERVEQPAPTVELNRLLREAHGFEGFLLIQVRLSYEVHPHPRAGSTAPQDLRRPRRICRVPSRLARGFHGMENREIVRRAAAAFNAGGQRRLHLA